MNDLDAERAQATVDSILSQGGRAAVVAFDVCEYAAVTVGVAKAESEPGPLLILVDNAGVPPRMAVAQVLDTTPDQWKSYVELNSYGVMNSTHAAVRGMRDRGQGRIILDRDRHDQQPHRPERHRPDGEDCSGRPPRRAARHRRPLRLPRLGRGFVDDRPDTPAQRRQRHDLIGSVEDRLVAVGARDGLFAGRGVGWQRSGSSLRRIRPIDTSC